MKDKDEKQVINELKRLNSKITPRQEFIDELEDSLLRQFSRKSRYKPYFPKIALFVACIIFLMLVISQVHITEHQSADINNEPDVYIYHSFNSFVYPFGATHRDLPTKKYGYADVNFFGDHLKKELKNNGVNVIYDHTDYVKKFQEQRDHYENSFEVSRVNLEESLQKYDSIKIVFDIAQDTYHEESTTTTINGQEVGRIIFHISPIHPNYEVNWEFAQRLHEKLEDKYPGLSRGVRPLENNYNLHFNQDLLGQSIMLGIGGSENTKDEKKRAAGYFAESVAEILKEN